MLDSKEAMFEKERVENIPHLIMKSLHYCLKNLGHLLQMSTNLGFGAYIVRTPIQTGRVLVTGQNCNAGLNVIIAFTQTY